MAKVKILHTDYKDEHYDEVSFKCPGCKLYHNLAFNGNPNPLKIWGFNGDLNNPTITPSILSTIEMTEDSISKSLFKGNNICHSFVTNGKIQFLGDCTHPLKNTTIELQEIK